MTEFYIETSIGDLHFSSHDLSSVGIVFDEISKKLLKITGIDNPTYRQDLLHLLDIYDLVRITTSNTCMGWFIKIHLSDPHYGNPEYKIHDKKDVSEDST
jgi:hypothetical protein